MAQHRAKCATWFYARPDMPPIVDRLQTRIATSADADAGKADLPCPRSVCSIAAGKSVRRGENCSLLNGMPRVMAGSQLT